MSDKYELSRRKALAALGTIGVAGAGAGLGTSALFGDEESFENNSITAGTANLIAELGLVEIDSSAPDELEVNLDEGATVTADGDIEAGLTVGDMKPGDCIVLRSTARVEANPMYVALSAEDVGQDGGETTEPEEEAMESGASDDGELGDNLEITFGYDSERSNRHDNTLEGSITPDEGSSTLSGSDFLSNAGNGYLYRGRQSASPGSGPPGGHADGDADPTRIGGNAEDSNVDRTAVTHFIEVCLPEEVGNIVQDDSVSFNLVWSAEQVRNNADPANSDEVDGNVN